MNKSLSLIKMISNITLFILLNISVFLILCHRGIKYAFGKVTFEQILFHLNVPVETVDADTYKTLFIFVGIYVIFLLIHTYIFINFIHNSNNMSKIYDDFRAFYNHILRVIKKFFNKTIIYIVICITIFITTILYIDKKYEIKKYYNTETSSFIEKNYTKGTVSFNEKRNLVLIFLESMEKGYTNASVLEKNLIPELEDISKKHISFSGYIQSRGSGWTQASHINMLMGIPLLFPKGVMEKNTQKSNIKEFLPNASSLPRVLHSNGYSTQVFLGSDSTFSDLDKFFATHNFDNLYDRRYFDGKGYKKKENLGTGWGYKDSFIYDRAFDEYKKLSSENKPFFMMLETIDTHLPNGYVEKNQKEFGDIRDAIRQSSIMCLNFIKKLYEYNKLYNTTVVIVGDHCWMMNRSVKLTEKMDKVKPREIYNVFINSCFSNENITHKRHYAPFDLAPTILEAVGATLEGHRFGLGTSLFSNEKTLLEKHGVKYINDELSKKSPFYLNLF